jgi:hypothetical protein
LRIRLPERTITAEIAAKSLRKAQTAIRDAAVDNIALVLQGHFWRCDCRSRPFRAAEDAKADASTQSL